MSRKRPKKPRFVEDETMKWKETLIKSIGVGAIAALGYGLFGKIGLLMAFVYILLSA